MVTFLFTFLRGEATFKYPSNNLIQDDLQMQNTAKQIITWHLRKSVLCLGVLRQIVGRRLSLPVIVGLVWFVLTFAAIVWAWGLDPEIFITPDEANNKHAAELIADTGQPYYVQDLDDPEDLIHQRFWVRLDDRVILAYPPLSYYIQGAFLKFPVIGRLLVAAIPALGVAAFASAMTFLGRQRRWLALLAPAASFPALFWLLRPWINMSTFLAFISIALLFWMLWREQRRMVWLGLCGGSMALAIAIRPDYTHLILGAGLLFTLAESRGRDARGIIWVFGLTTITAVLLMAVFNALTTGSPFQFGYDEIIFGQEGGRALPPFIDKLYFLVLPYGIPPLDDVVDMVKKYWIDMGMVVVLLISVVIAIPSLLRGGGRRSHLYGLGVALIILFTVSRITIDRAGALDPRSDVSQGLPRIWSVVYLFASVPIFALAMKSKLVQYWWPPVVLVLILGISGAVSVYQGGYESLTAMRRQIDQSQINLLQWEREIPDDAVVYSTHLDKVLWNRRDVAVLPSKQGPELEDIAKVASSIARVATSGRPVYVIRTNWTQTDLALVNNYLAREGLVLEANGTKSLDWWKAVRLPQVVALEPEASGVFAGNFRKPAPDFTITVKQDGAAHNYVLNPSFEVDMTGWDGIDLGPMVRKTGEEALFGENSLRMELRDATGIGQQSSVRRTYIIDRAELESDVWSAGAKVLIAELDGAEVVFRVYLRSPTGIIDRNVTAVANPLPEFQTLIIEGKTFAAETVDILLQILVIPLELGASGVVYWDGIQMMSGPHLPLDYCDGDHNGCDWAGPIGLSQSSRSGGIDWITLSLGDGTKVNLIGPFHTNDQLVFRGSEVYLKQRDGVLHRLDVPPFELGDRLNLVVKSPFTPILSVEATQ